MNNYHLELSGIISCEDYSSYSNFPTVFLIQMDGYKVDLLGRIHEAIGNYGRRVTLRYFIVEEPMPKEQVLLSFLRVLAGDIWVAHEHRSGQYSEWTPWDEWKTEFQVGSPKRGRHDLYKELSGQNGKFLYLECNFREEANEL